VSPRNLLFASRRSVVVDFEAISASFLVASQRLDLGQVDSRVEVEELVMRGLVAHLVVEGAPNLVEEVELMKPCLVYHSIPPIELRLSARRAAGRLVDSLPVRLIAFEFNGLRQDAL
jgi:hypothetical protein